MDAAESEETWDPADAEVRWGLCEACRRMALVMQTEDPFVCEDIIDRPDGPDPSWCYPCYRERAMDV